MHAPLLTDWLPGGVPGPVGRLVVGAARLAGARGDAYVRVDAAEARRRVGHGLGAVVDLVPLDDLLSLPDGVPVACDGLAAERLARLRDARPGVVEIDGREVVRTLLRPCRVEAVTVAAGPPVRWRTSLRRAAVLSAAAPASLLADDDPGHARLAEADAAGVGVAVRGDPLVLPAAPPRAAVKAARWRFEENAYRAWLLAAAVPA